MLILLIWILGLLIYFLPTIAGWNKRNVGAIFALNLFLGWTAIGWIVAFIWAMTVDPEQTTNNRYSNSQFSDKPLNRFEELGRLEHRYSTGEISKQYYESEKARLMNAR